MKKNLLLLTAIAVFIFSCNQSDEKENQLLNKEKLPSQLFTIDTKSDTTFTTEKGAIISIPKDALYTSERFAKLVIREAYSIEDIIASGLTTESNGQLLSSGGMIYINAAGGQTIQITKAISIKIPTSFIDTNMKVFKGDSDANGKINWTKPDTIPKNPQTLALSRGKALFETNCRSCHAIDKNAIGPELDYILRKTPNKKILYAYTRNNMQIMDSDLSESWYYRCLYEEFNKTPMNLFQNLSNQDLDNLYQYIENESELHSLPYQKNVAAPCFDSCKTYLSLKSKLQRQKDKLSREKIDMVIEEITNPPSSSLPINPGVSVSSPVVSKVIPANNQSLFYQFKIEAFGWYNIDILLKDKYGTAESRLLVRLIGQYKLNINLFLVIPSAKVLGSGGKLQGKEDIYGFYATDGKIYLPQNIKAYVFAMGEFEHNIIFAKKEFTTSTNQEFELSLSTTTEEQFNSEIKNFHFSDLEITSYKTKNADTLRKIIKELKDVEKIKPTNCDCNCGMLTGEASYINDTTQAPPVKAE